MELKQPIYDIEEWNITEKEFSIDTVYRNETTFALSNGYLGTRGTFEEGYDFSVEEGLEGNFINGFYESEAIRYGEWNYGFPQHSQSLLNLPNAKTIKLFIDGEQFDLRQGQCTHYERSLSMKEGLVVRNIVWTSPKGRQVRIHSKRLVSLTRKNILQQEYEVTPLNFDGSIQLISTLDAKVENHTRKTNPLVDYGPFGRHLTTDSLWAENDTFYYQGTTKNSRLTMACMGLHLIKLPDSIKQQCVSPLIQTSAGDDQADITYCLPYVEQGQTLRLTKWIAYTCDRDIAPPEQQEFLQKILQDCKEAGSDIIRQEQWDALNAYWHKADVRVEGDAALQQGLRFNLFHIMQASGRDGRTGLGAKGLSGEGYEGHYFWDTEMYVLPVFIYTHSQLAKSLLDYRYETLPRARERARVLGHAQGALYPWRTINGEEASTYFPLGTAQYHVNADVAYAFKLYVKVTGDMDYLKKKAAEVLIETARVWADVGCFVKSRNGRYCICAVTGPDEYNAIVDNNFYTNLMARENIRDAIWALDYIQKQDSDIYEQLITKLSVTGKEVEYWQRIVDNMYFPYDEELKVYPQDDGFIMRKPWDESGIPPKKRHLLYENYHPLFIFRQRMAKQADAILGMFLYSNYFTTEELKRNYDFYQEVTLHHSSLSTSVFGMLASRIGYEEEACRYFRESARMDLDDYHNNFYAGIHAANMAGTWQAIAFGFAGIRTNGNTLELSPKLPQQWKSMEFRITYQGSELLIHMEDKNNYITLENDMPLRLNVWKKEITLQKEGDTYHEEL